MLRTVLHGHPLRTGARRLVGVLSAVCVSCFNPTSYDATSEPSVTSDTSSGSATTASSSSTSLASTTGTTTGTAATSTGATEPATTTTTCSPCCGDGEIDPPGEECDDGNPVDGDGCSSDCRKEFRLVFVTSETFAADLGGNQGADEKCELAASAVGLPGTFRAWLSSSTQEPLGVFVQSLVPYRRLDGMQVAENWLDLIDGELDNPINVTETMMFAPGPVCDARAVWTASFNNGTEYDAVAKSCSDWSSTTGSTTGGNPSVTDVWSNGCPLSCSTLASLYCFEQ